MMSCAGNDDDIVMPIVSRKLRRENEHKQYRVIHYKIGKCNEIHYEAA